MFVVMEKVKESNENTVVSCVKNLRPSVWEEVGPFLKTKDNPPGRTIRK